MSVKQAKIVIFFLSFFFALFLIFRPMDVPKDWFYWLSLLLGSSLGIVTCSLVNNKWSAHPNANSNSQAASTNNLQSKRITIIAIVGLISGNIVASIFSPQAEILITNFVLSWLVVVLYLSWCKEEIAGNMPIVLTIIPYRNHAERIRGYGAIMGWAASTGGCTGTFVKREPSSNQDLGAGAPHRVCRCGSRSCHSIGSRSGSTVR